MFHQRPNRVLRLEPIDVRHADIEKDDVRPQLANDVRQSARIATLAHDVEIRIAMKKLPQSPA
jgi:hypothetical protein